MSQHKLRAGTMDELRHPTGDWLFVDMGFSQSSASCGVLSDSAGGDDAWSASPESVTFGECVKKVCGEAGVSGPPLHLVLEAPLSFCFTEQGNPLGRSIEKQGRRTRYWYVGLGCSVLVSAQFLLRALAATTLRREVRLFEGFVSFKTSGVASDHEADVRGLRDAVAMGLNEAFSQPTPLPGHPQAKTVSILNLVQGRGAIPPITGAIPPIIKAAAS